MKALFLGLPLHGHTNPSLSLVRALVDRGEECAYFSTPAFQERIEAAGARFRPYRNTFLGDLSQLPDRTDELSWLLMRTTGEVLAQELEAFRAERPDYVITDSVAPWGQWAAQLLDRPVVTSITTFAINRHVLAFAVAGGSRPKSGRRFFSKVRHIVKASALGRRLRREHRVRGTGVMELVFGSSNLNIVYTSRLFQPCADSFDERFQFIGPSLGPRADPVAAGWADAADTPLVYVSLGTLFNANPDFYRHCFEAFRNEPVRVLMATGTTISASSLGPSPPNVVVQPFVPQLDVLGRASAFVSHGGMNSVSESLLHGVPMVIVPQMSEQELVGRQVDALGAGLYVRKAEATAARLRESVRRVLHDDTFRQRAAIVRESFEAAGGAAHGADAIVAFTRQLAVARRM